MKAKDLCKTCVKRGDCEFRKSNKDTKVAYCPYYQAKGKDL
jgi:hypothetical protein